MKATLTLSSHINLKIKLNDKVRLIDGSGLTHYDNNDIDELYIVLSYPKITKSERHLKDLIFEVDEIGLKTNVCTGYNCAYIQDIVVSFNGVKFRTCSAFVENVNN